jgi:hypothetical protein
MPSLRSIANEYHHAANRIAARADRAGQLSENQRRAIDSFRDSAAKIEALIRPEDSLPKQVEVQEAGTVTATKKFKAHKAATPQELLEKAQ